MKICKLKNGTKMPHSVVQRMMSQIEELNTSNDIHKIYSLYELALKVHNKEDQFFSSYYEDYLKEINLLENDGTVHNIVRDIVESAITLDDNAIYIIGNPIAEFIE